MVPYNIGFFILDYNGGQMQEQSDPVNKNKNWARHFYVTRLDNIYSSHNII